MNNMVLAKIDLVRHNCMLLALTIHDILHDFASHAGLQIDVNFQPSL